MKKKKVFHPAHANCPHSHACPQVGEGGGVEGEKGRDSPTQEERDGKLLRQKKRERRKRNVFLLLGCVCVGTQMMLPKDVSVLRVMRVNCVPGNYLTDPPKKSFRNQERNPKFEPESCATGSI